MSGAALATVPVPGLFPVTLRHDRRMLPVVPIQVHIRYMQESTQQWRVRFLRSKWLLRRHGARQRGTCCNGPAHQRGPRAMLAPTWRVVAEKDVYHVISVGRPCTLKGVLGAIGAHARGAGRAAADRLQHAVHVLCTAPALVR